MHKDESLWVKRLYRSIKPHHLANQEPDSLLGYDNNGTPVVIEAGTNVTISGGTISASGSGSGITTLNGLVADPQIFATGTTGTDFTISSATSTHTFNLPVASGVNTGKLSSADWTTFNSKFTLPALTTGSVLFSNGTTIAQDNANFFWDDAANRLGLGTTSPDRLFHVEASDAVTNAVTYGQRLTHITSGTATTGFGLGKEWELENGSGTNVVAATEEITWSDATAGTEDATYTLKLVRAGALTEALNVSSTGHLTTQNQITVNSNLNVTTSGAILFTGRSRWQSPSDGVFTFYNNAATNFDRLQFGGTTSSFPSLKRSSTSLECRLADDSGYTTFRAGNISGSIIYLNGFTSALKSPSSGVIGLYDSAETDFGRLQFGGTTSSFPSLKRSTTELQVRLADDSGDANLKAKQVTVTGRLLGAKGADVASANDLTLGNDGNVFRITGTTQINAITTTGWTAGSVIILIFDDAITVKHNTAGGGSTAVMLLAGAVDFSATTNDTLTLVYDGTRWMETSRTVI